MFPMRTTVPWHNLVWFTGATPRHSFLLWIALHIRLATHDRIYRFTPGPLACVFCLNSMESHNHLFFQCTYTCFIWQGLLQRMGIHYVQRSWEDLTLWAATHWKHKKNPRHAIPKMCLGAAIYYIWRERNERTFGTRMTSKEVLLASICAHMSAMIGIRWKTDPSLHLYLEGWT